MYLLVLVFVWSLEAIGAHVGLGIVLERFFRKNLTILFVLLCLFYVYKVGTFLHLLFLINVVIFSLLNLWRDSES